MNRCKILQQTPIWEPLHELEFPIDDWKDSKKDTDRWQYRLKLISLWAGGILTSYYGFLKIRNKIIKGKFIIDEKHHDHFFKTPDELKHSLENLNKLLVQSFPLLRKNIAHDSFLLPDSNNITCTTHDSFASTLQEYQNAISSHDCHDDCHNHHEGHHHEEGRNFSIFERSQHDCHPVCHHHHEEKHLPNATPPKGVLKKINYIAHDFYHESFGRIVELTKSLSKRRNFNQAMQFAELSAIKNFHEKGLIITLANGVLFVTTQLAFETVEFIILGPGMHLLCHVGNYLAVSVTTSTYVLYFYIKNNRQVSYLPWKDRMKTILQSSSLSMKSSKLNYQGIEKLGNLSFNDRFLLSLTLLQKSVEMKLKFARNSSKIPVKLSRKLAGQLGKLQKELGNLYLHLYANSFKAWPNDLQGEVLSWLNRLEDIHKSIRE